jgi:prevent-host-death family protein
VEKRIPVRVLNQQTSAVLAEVAAGHPVTVTSNGKPIARIVPVPEMPGWLARMVEEGMVIPATDRGPIRLPAQATNSHVNLSNVIARDRDED